MDTQKSEVEIKKIFSILDEINVQEGGKVHELKSSFFAAYKLQWKETNSELKKMMLQMAGELDVDDGLRPAVLGLRDSTRNVREEAKKTLQKLAPKVTLPNENRHTLQPHVAGRAAGFALTVYNEMKLAARN